MIEDMWQWWMERSKIGWWFTLPSVHSSNSWKDSWLLAHSLECSKKSKEEERSLKKTQLRWSSLSHKETQNGFQSSQFNFYSKFVYNVLIRVPFSKVLVMNIQNLIYNVIHVLPPWCVSTHLYLYSTLE